MTNKTKLGLSALAVIVGLGSGAAFVGPSMAQAVGGTAPQATAPTKEVKRERGHARHANFAKHAGRIDGRLAFLKAELKITPAQETQWSAYEKVMRDNAAETKARFEKMRAEREKATADAKAAGKDRPDRPKLSAVERMERMQTFGKERLDREAKVLAAFKPLYASLSDDQKKTADELIAQRGHGRGHGHRMGR
jgi:hypothetical protein